MAPELAGIPSPSPAVHTTYAPLCPVWSSAPSLQSDGGRSQPSGMPRGRGRMALRLPLDWTECGRVLLGPVSLSLGWRQSHVTRCPL